ncbi:rRNA (guanine-N1)-methyltransferase [Amycolatopsis acidiphila]|uniref:rRNA (Guanine-N1)-methyltransferase n=1 Tax=Amycolatopsis acidiphila TaxID=715473 RepID=A0A558A347_9PSEU|nr:rRNA (guanine-N1)-methyltransferase [Amycolatopsis acidiphila]TVT18678.1 rRNA (guanine-N1)-methyltransferase [Amycolatopsis acidiphila]UIJ61584.1 rRNA (guanine-N1)-methyltransferase [Amycolatopsis acidiphila]GHG59082.1 rRNA (guanine-N1)-methyltransferase [Amycolatopsis acidiphila]
MTSPALPPAVVAALRCPVCGDAVGLAGRMLRCPRGHAFDLAKQGYVNLLHAKIPSGTADTSDMVAARAEFLGAGHYAGLAGRLAERVAPSLGSGLVVDAGAGTGYYLARVLQEAGGATGLALDVSALALRRAARAHDRLGAAVWNLWEPWPVATGSASVLLNVFAPRNGAEFHRVLRPGGSLFVVSPQAAHLRELASVVDLLEVDGRKEERLEGALAGFFEPVAREEHTVRLTLSPVDVRRVVLMGPNAHHPERLKRLDDVHEPLGVTASFVLSEYRRTP